MGSSSERIAQVRQQAFFHVYMPYIITVAVAVIAVYAIIAIGLWKTFEKAGIKGWKALIPFYNMYVLYKLVWKPLWFWLFMAGAAFVSIFSFVRVDNTIATILAFAILLVLFALFALKIVVMIKLARSFDKNIGFAIGLILLDFIFIPILGLGKSECVNPVGEPLVYQVKEKKSASSRKSKASAKAEKKQSKDSASDVIDIIEESKSELTSKDSAEPKIKKPQKKAKKIETKAKDTAKEKTTKAKSDNKKSASKKTDDKDEAVKKLKSNISRQVSNTAKDTKSKPKKESKKAAQNKSKKTNSKSPKAVEVSDDLVSNDAVVDFE